MRFNKKFIVLLAFVSLFLCIITLQDTYAKYASYVNGSADVSIARWRILVNDFDVRNELTSSNVIIPHFAGNEYIAGGVIAPTSTGYFEIEIDGTETDVAFTYHITITNSDDSIVDDVRITGCTLDGQSVSFEDDTIAGTVYLTDLSRVKRLIVYVEWNDGNGQTMDNAADTSTTSNVDPVAKINVAANFIQARA